MIFSLRTHALITFALFAALNLVAWVGQGVAQTQEPPGVTVGSRQLFMGLVFGLFLLLGLSLPPLIVKARLAVHRTAGYGDKPLARGLAAAERPLIYLAWGLMLAGAAIAIPAAIQGGLFEAPADEAPR